MRQTHHLVCLPEDAGTRLDQFLARKVADHSREYLKSLIEAGHARVEGKTVRPAQKLKAGARVELVIPDPVAVAIPAEAVALDVCYEDEHLLVVNKPRGMLTHPTSPARPIGSLVNALLAHCRDLGGIHGELRPGIVHRLDRDTSGLLVVAKNDAVQHALSAQLKSRTMIKSYVALARGHVSPRRGTLAWPIGRHPIVRNKMRVDESRGRPSRTDYHAVRLYAAASLVWLRLHTGRTHQIRVHLAQAGHPLVGDVLYGSKRESEVFRGIALHSARLAFVHPVKKEWLRCSRPVPADFRELLVRAIHGDPLTPGP